MVEDLYLYKFRSINKWLIEGIVKNTIYFAHPAELNDPFDCQVDLGGALSRAIAEAKGDRHDFLKRFLDNEEFINNWHNVIGNMGVFSFSLYRQAILEETLMWSHYAEEHRGVCFQYVIPETFIKKLMDDSEDTRLVCAAEVDYSEDGFVEFLLQAPLIDYDFTAALLRKYLFKKSPSWRHENEGRMLLRRSGTLHLPPRCLKSVCFGVRSSVSDRELVRKLASDYAGCDEVYKVVRGDGDHKLKVEIHGEGFDS
jgi:hypothetical protein